MRRAGISPLIASVLLMAFTLSVAMLAGPFFSQVMQNAQTGTSEDAEQVMTSANLGLEILQVSYNRTTSNLTVIVQNTGDQPVTGLSIGVLGGKPQQRVFNTTLNQKGVNTFQISIQKTFPLQEITASLTDYPVSTKRNIECTPTQGLVGYWTFNQEQTNATHALDYSINDNSAELRGSVTTGREGMSGEAYFFDGADDELDIPKTSELAPHTESYSTVFWAKYRHHNQSNIYGIHSQKAGSPIGQLFQIVENSGTRYLKWAITNEDDTGSEIDSTFKNNQWRLFTGVVDRKSDKIRLFKDTIQVANSSFPQGNIPGRELLFGTRAGHREWRMSGKLDEFRIYNRSLSQAEIRRLYHIRDKNWAVNACKLAG